jgi:hypothetical protein
MSVEVFPDETVGFYYNKNGFIWGKEMKYALRLPKEAGKYFLEFTEV